MELPSESSTLVPTPGTSYCYMEDQQLKSVQCRYVSQRTLIRCQHKRPFDQPFAVCGVHAALSDHIRDSFHQDRTFMDTVVKKRYKKVMCQNSVVSEGYPAFNLLGSCYNYADNSLVPLAPPSSLRFAEVFSKKELPKQQVHDINKTIELLKLKKELLLKNACYYEELKASTSKVQLSGATALKERLKEVRFRPTRLQNSRKLQRERPPKYCSFGKSRRIVGSEGAFPEDATKFECMLVLDEIIEDVAANLGDNEEGCRNRCLPLAHFCREHILLDDLQQLFEKCNDCQGCVPRFGAGCCTKEFVGLKRMKKTSLASLLPPLSVNVGEGNFSEVKPNLLLKLSQNTTPNGLSGERPKAIRKVNFMIDAEEGNKNSAASSMRTGQNFSTCDLSLQASAPEEKVVITEVITCSRIRPFNREAFEQSRRTSGLLKESTNKGYASVKKPASRKRLPSTDLNLASTLQPTLGEKALTSDFLHIAKSSNTATPPFRQSPVAAQLYKMYSPPPPPKPAAPFALPAAQSDRLLKQPFRVAYRASDNRPTLTVAGTQGHPKNFQNPIHSLPSPLTLQDKKATLMATGIPGIPKISKNVQNAKPPTPLISKVSGTTESLTMNGQSTNESTSLNPTTNASNEAETAKSVSSPKLIGENHNENLHSSQHIVSGLAQGETYRPANQTTASTPRIIANTTKKIVAIRNGTRFIVGHSQQFTDGLTHPVSTPVLTTASRTTQPILRLPLYQREFLQNKAVNVAASQSETELKKVNIQYRNSNGHSQSIVQATVPNNSLSNGLLIHKNSGEVEKNCDGKTAASDFKTEDSNGHSQSIVQATVPNNDFHTNNKDEPVATHINNGKLPVTNDSHTQDDLTNNGWQGVNGNPLDMLAHVASLSQAAQSTDHLHNGFWLKNPLYRGFMASTTKHPSVLWAQREGFLYLTIEVDDAKIEDLTLSEQSLHFKGNNTSGSYEATLEFFENVDKESLKKYSGTRFLELTVNKATGKWWSRLLKNKEKVHWLKVDFGKWKDEDESDIDDEPAAGASGFDLSNYMSQLGGAPGGAPDFDGLDMGEEDDDDMPDLEDTKEEEDEKDQSK
ncbi:unnamed protein product, partial [Mesorhabditis belari]|uniref:CS domain-containing protein n=1 Tax=Mesorhabditis belari TaxID=2138241 RepID=A0AAF3J1B2_9BILA